MFFISKDVKDIMPVVSVESAAYGALKYSQILPYMYLKIEQVGDLKLVMMHI